MAGSGVCEHLLWPALPERRDLVGGALVLPLRGQLPRPGADATERGVPVDHTTIYRWVQRYAPELDKRTRWYRRVGQWAAQSWRVDETYLRIGGR